MKRLHNKIINGSNLLSNNFNVINLEKHTCYVYTWKEQKYEKLYLCRNDMELPFVDVYELKAYSMKGLLCGYAFDFYSKNPIIKNNYIIAANMHNLSVTNFKNQKSCMQLVYKLKGCNIYSIPGMATLLTISQNFEMKELLDI